MGQKTAGSTLAFVFAQLVSKRTVSQAALAQDAKVDSEVIKARLEELREAGVPLSCRREGRNNVWTVAKSWFPSGVVFDRDEATRLLSLLLRVRRSADRDAFIERIVTATIGAKQLPAVASAARSIDGTLGEPSESEEHRTQVERAIIERAAISVRYQKADQDEPEWRTISPQAVVNATPPHVVALDHRRGELRSYRFSRMHRVLREPAVAYRPADERLVAEKVRRSVYGFDGAPLETIVFVIHSEVWGRAHDNLPFVPTRLEKVERGMRVVLETSARPIIVRFLLAYGSDVTIETDAIREEVIAHARKTAEWHERGASPPKSQSKRKTNTPSISGGS